MPNIVEIEYKQTGESVNINDTGMRPMAARAFAARTSQYILVKAPPASGKSRALMFIALDKLKHQGIKKVIVAVPERSIGASFAPSDLIGQNNFFTNWEPNEEYNLCTAGSDGSISKVSKFKKFLESDEEILICTHATLRYAFEGLKESVFNDTLLAIDEFHHVSADADNVLGEVLRTIMQKSNAHIVAMTGSYFRGDAVPVLEPVDEDKFTKVTYNYYEQLNGYKYLKSLGIGYHFYQGKYISAINEVLDTDKKTIIHIPSPNSGESTKDKISEVDFIIDSIGTLERQDEETGIMYVKRDSDGKILKIADLVYDVPQQRDKVAKYLREMDSEDDIDIIIALGMAKEGFDWPYCEHALTVGYRGSLTEVIQIIGRCTRDSDNKSHAQFTNLIASPEAMQDDVKVATNNMLKAITVSLLMEQVMAPNFKFKTKKDDEDDEDDDAKGGGVKIRGFKEPSSKRVKDIIESDLNDLKAKILQDDSMLKAMPGNIDAEVMNRDLIPKIIRVAYPDLSEVEVQEVREHVVVDSVFKNGEIKEEGGKKFLLMADKFVNIDDINMDLIDQVNPFQRAFEILSKSVTTKVLKVIQDHIENTRIQMDFGEAKILWPKIQAFFKEHNREPSLQSLNAQERRMAECIIYLKAEKQKQMADGQK